MDNLKLFREEMDVVNSELCELMIKRFELLAKIMNIKNNKGLETHDPAREGQMLKQLAQQLKDSPYKQDVLNIFKDIFKHSLTYCKNQRI